MRLMKLAEVCELIVDCEHKTAPTQTVGYPSIRTPNIGPGYFILDGVNRVSKETYNLWTKRAIPQTGDLIMAREAPVGNTAIITGLLRPCLGQRTMLIQPDSTKVEPLFLNYLLNGPYIQGIIHSKANGATVAHLNMKDVRSLPLISLPPIQEQQRIARLLSAYDELIENNQRRIRLLEEMARSLYREWFVHFRFPDPRLHSMTSAAGGAVPEGWSIINLGSLASVITKGTTPTTLGKAFTDSGVNFFKVESISEAGAVLPSKLAHVDTVTHELLKRSQLQHRDILFSIAGAIGRTALVHGRFLPANTNQALAIIRATDATLAPYLIQVLRSPEFLHFNAGHIVQTAQANVSLSVLRAAPITLPSQELLTKFSERVEPLYQAVDCLTTQNENLRETRDLLLPRLLSGQLKLEAY